MSPTIPLIPQKPDEDNMELNQLKEKSHKIRLVAFDLDGTLLKSDHTISQLSLLAIEELRRKGIKIAIASGRIFTMLESYCHTLNNPDFVISVNGGSIDDLKNDKIVTRNYVPFDDAKRVIQYCLSEQLDCSLLTRKSCYFTRSSERIKRFESYNTLAKKQGLKEIDLNYYDEMTDEIDQIEKILIYETNSSKTRQLMKFIDQNTQLSHTSSGKHLLDVSSKNISKGEALKTIMSYMGINKDACCVFGDYDNDVSMFEVAGIAIAMGNASKKALEASDYVTESHDDEGIAIAIKEIFSEVIK